MSSQPAVFCYVIPVYNEEERIVALVDELLPFLKAHPGSLLIISDNASKDATVARARARIRGEENLVHICEVPIKGQGIAFWKGLAKLEELRVTEDSWVVFNAADLPFKFSDVLAVMKWGESYDLVIGSKAHPRSQVSRGFIRTFMSIAFRAIRFAFLGMRTNDPQGTLFFKARHLDIRKKCDADNYFFATELCYVFEKEKKRILEAPVVLGPSLRPSKVNVVKDSLRVFVQTWRFARRRGRIVHARPVEFASGEVLGPDWE